MEVMRFTYTAWNPEDFKGHVYMASYLEPFENVIRYCQTVKFPKGEAWEIYCVNNISFITIICEVCGAEHWIPAFVKCDELLCGCCESSLKDNFDELCGV